MFQYTKAIAMATVLAAALCYTTYNGDQSDSGSATLPPTENASRPASQSTKASDTKATASRSKGKARKYEMPAKLRGVPERIIEHTGYTVSFNREHNNPNYVAWELTADETEGELPRSNNFMPDPDVPTPHQVVTSDYRGSGYDRGHMAPAADMKWSHQAMNECFYMSNICPQNHSLNAGSWQTLEDACRRWAKQEGRVYIVCGPVYKGKRHKTIGTERVITVPEGFFKVVLSLKKGEEKAIGFYYANHDGKQPMSQAAMRVDDVEAMTGMDFFVNVPDKTENRVEATFSLKDWR